MASRLRSSSLLRPALSLSLSPVSVSVSFSVSPSVLPFTPSLNPHSYFYSYTYTKPRTMSTTTPPAGQATQSSTTTPSKKEFLCIIPDHPGMVQKRLEVRPKHLEEIKPLVDSGDVVLGGGIFHSHPTTTTETPSFKGSAMVVLAENEAAAREVLARDVYATSGVWDLEGVSVIPFKSAVRIGL